MQLSLSNAVAYMLHIVAYAVACAVAVAYAVAYTVRSGIHASHTCFTCFTLLHKYRYMYIDTCIYTCKAIMRGSLNPSKMGRRWDPCALICANQIYGNKAQVFNHTETLL